MTFFKKYNGTTNTRLARIETLIWVLIYGGLLTLVIGFSMSRLDEDSGNLMVIAGGIAAAIGVVLVVVRSRLREEK